MWCPHCGRVYVQQTTCVHGRWEWPTIGYFKQSPKPYHPPGFEVQVVALRPFPDVDAVRAARRVGGRKAVAAMAYQLSREFKELCGG